MKRLLALVAAAALTLLLVAVVNGGADPGSSPGMTIHVVERADDGCRHRPRRRGRLRRRFADVRESGFRRGERQGRHRPGVLRPHRGRQVLGVQLHDVPGRRADHRRGPVLRRRRFDVRDHRRHGRLPERAGLVGTEGQECDRVRLHLQRDWLAPPRQESTTSERTRPHMVTAKGSGYRSPRARAPPGPGPIHMNIVRGVGTLYLARFSRVRACARDGVVGVRDGAKTRAE